jgi:hypothetical protein
VTSIGSLIFPAFFSSHVLAISGVQSVLSGLIVHDILIQDTWFASDP